MEKFLKSSQLRKYLFNMLDRLLAEHTYGMIGWLVKTKCLQETLIVYRTPSKFFGDARGPRGMFWTNMVHFGPPEKLLLLRTSFHNVGSMEQNTCVGWPSSQYQNRYLDLAV